MEHKYGEPWKLVETASSLWLYNNDEMLLIEDDRGNTFQNLEPRDFRRIMDCVNLLAGHNPASVMVVERERWEAFTAAMDKAFAAYGEVGLQEQAIALITLMQDVWGPYIALRDVEAGR